VNIIKLTIAFLSKLTEKTPCSEQSDVAGMNRCHPCSWIYFRI